MPKCLRSLLDQSVPPDEIIIVDDGSTDNSVQIAEEFVRENPRVKLYRNEKNRGVNFTCNRGIELATCDFVNALAVDDEYLPGFFEKALRLLAENPEARLSGAICEYCDMATGAKWFLGGAVSDKPCYLSPDELVALARRDRLHIATGTMLVHRQSFLDAGKYLADLRWHSDWFVMFCVGLRGGICFIPEPVIQFNINPASFSNKGRQQIKSQTAVVRAILLRLEEKQFQDFGERVREGGLLASFGKEMFWVLATTRRYWKYLNAPYIWNALKWTARVEARRILPKPVAEFCLKIAGYKRLPKKQA